ncbi:hypothetical protein H5T51_05790 [Candidatus Bathyarchaeota archaeon]|nr:hypothetical protein [Candidatus Bathyarchaeota archaeon]
MFNEHLLLKLSKDIFEDSKVIGRCLEASEESLLNMDEEERLSFVAELWVRITSALVDSIKSIAKDGKKLSRIAEAWLSNFKDVISAFSRAEMAELSKSIKSELRRYYLKLLRSWPPYYQMEFEKEYGKSGPDEVILIVVCQKCSNRDVLRVSVPDLVAWKVECRRCGYKIPKKPEVSRRFINWAEEYISRHMVPALDRLLNEMSIITCEALVHEKVAIRDAKCEIRGRIWPPHSKRKVTLVLTGPDNLEETLSTSTDDGGAYRVDYVFRKLGNWTICAYWDGDEDHLGASTEEKILVWEFPR